MANELRILDGLALAAALAVGFSVAGSIVGPLLALLWPAFAHNLHGRFVETASPGLIPRAEAAGCKPPIATRCPAIQV